MKLIRRELLGLFLGLTAGTRAAAEAPAAPPAENERKLEVHGFLSQAFAISDGYQVLGIPSEGTFDYRTAALQLRATLTAKDSIVIQVGQARLGESPIMAVRNEIDLDWIFYERQLGAGTSVRVGRIKIPFGIYNEIRFVGPLLPFFRPADAFYGEGSYVFSSINGAALSKSLFARHRFSVDADLYAGEWSFVQGDPELQQIAGATRARARGLGGQLWLNTPLDGLRFGVGGDRSTWSNSVEAPPGVKVRHKRWVASVDGNFERFRLSAELGEHTSPGVLFASSYVLVSGHVTDKLSVNLQASRSHVKLDLVLAQLDDEIGRDYAAGLSYAFRPDLVAKVENHWTRGRNFEEPGVTIFSPALSADYVILSLSALF